MWYFGLGIAAVLVLIAGMAMGFMNRLVTKQEGLPSWAKTDFWNYRSHLTDNHDGVYFDYLWRWLLTTIGLGNGCHLMQAIHWSFIAVGAGLGTVSVQYAATSMVNFLHILGYVMLVIYVLRRLGQYITDNK